MKLGNGGSRLAVDNKSGSPRTPYSQPPKSYLLTTPFNIVK
jgi:hypothetical protein